MRERELVRENSGCTPRSTCGWHYWNTGSITCVSWSWCGSELCRLFCCGLKRNICNECWLLHARDLELETEISCANYLGKLRNQCRTHVLIAVENLKPRYDSLLCLAAVHKAIWVKVIQAEERWTSTQSLPATYVMIKHAGNAPRATAALCQ